MAFIKLSPKTVAIKILGKDLCIETCFCTVFYIVIEFGPN